MNAFTLSLGDIVILDYVETFNVIVECLETTCFETTVVACVMTGVFFYGF